MFAPSCPPQQVVAEARTWIPVASPSNGGARPTPFHGSARKWPRISGVVDRWCNDECALIGLDGAGGGSHGECQEDHRGDGDIQIAICHGVLLLFAFFLESKEVTVKFTNHKHFQVRLLRSLTQANVSNAYARHKLQQHN